jgi:LPS sulfotransferase NodH
MVFTSGMPRLTNASGRAEAYLICATPRTGSSLLCGLLESTGVAGHPESYFRQPDEQSWASGWGIVQAPDGTFSYADYVQSAIRAGRTKNGVFAARVMWGTMEEVVDKLEAVHPDCAGADSDLLNRAFGRTRLVYLQRGDAVAQAVSWLRAEQTDVWFQTVQSGQPQPEQEPRYSFDEIQKLAQLIDEHNAAWQEWFRSVGIQPHSVRYEDLEVDPAGVTRNILDFLGLELPPEREILAQHRRLSDEINARWIQRYLAELTRRTAPS